MQLPDLLIQGRRLKLSSRQAAINSFEQCFEEAIASNNKPNQVAALTELALEFIETKQIPALERATQVLEQAAELNSGLNISSLTAHLNYALGINALEKYQLEESFSLLQSAYSLYESSSKLDNNLAGLSLVDDALGKYYGAISQYPQAMSHFERSLTRRQSIKSPANIDTQTQMFEWHPRLFKVDPNTKEWIYTYADARPWDAHNDISTFESNLVICTRTRHRAHNINRSSNRSDSNIHPARQTSTLTRGPSPSLNNIPAGQAQSLTPTNSNSAGAFLSPHDDILVLLKRIETALIRTNERLDAHEQDLTSLRTDQRTREQSKFNLLSPYIQFLLLIVVAIILKYILN